MQTNVKTLKLHGQEFESEVTVRHRTTLGRWDASLADYPHLIGEGDTEALALADLATMLSSDPDAHDEIEKKNEEAKEKALQEEKKKREETKQQAEEAKRQAEKNAGGEQEPADGQDPADVRKARGEGGTGLAEAKDAFGNDPATGDSGAPGAAHGSDKGPGEDGPKAGGPSAGEADPLHKLEMNVTGEKNPDGSPKPPPSKGATDDWGVPGGEATDANTDTGKTKTGDVRQTLKPADGATIKKG